ncbi:MAG: tRNA (adenosine(37)-N6)-threonylcarbamoyltransferase complex ATPase subunit type 1 TsaE [Deltaproteobacteria bacterium]|nr:tRNA (adenosine(37)-N6)-threonylcarbamoyltransferase complex ATPase subunit type 1 TsaE [Deltaproteobacteria bacterium]
MAHRCRIRTISAEETRRIGRVLGAALQPGDWIGLTGELGAGKTCLVQGMAEGAGVDPAVAVTSPTFTILQTYPGRLPLHHMDFYRLSSDTELFEIAYDELVEGGGACVVEWCEKLPAARPRDALVLRLQILDEDGREIAFEASGERAELLLERVRGVRS